MPLFLHYIIVLTAENILNFHSSIFNNASLFWLVSDTLPKTVRKVVGWQCNEYSFEYRIFVKFDAYVITCWIILGDKR